VTLANGAVTQVCKTAILALISVILQKKEVIG